MHAEALLQLPDVVAALHERVLGVAADAVDALGTDALQVAEHAVRVADGLLGLALQDLERVVHAALDLCPLPRRLAAQLLDLPGDVARRALRDLGQLRLQRDALLVGDLAGGADGLLAGLGEALLELVGEGVPRGLRRLDGLARSGLGGTPARSRPSPGCARRAR